MGKKKAIIGVIICLIIAGVGTIAYKGYSYLKTESASTNELMLRAIHALEDRNDADFKNVFLSDIKMQDGFDDQVEMLMDYYAGEFIDYNVVSANVNVFTNNKGTTKTVSCQYKVETAEETYIVSVVSREEADGEFGL